MGQCFLYGNGGNDRLQVATGLAEPQNPRENMLWVKSDKAGRKYVFAAEAPESPFEGLIWFRATAAGIITQTNVYTGGTWDSVDTYMYLGGEWVQIAATSAYLLNGSDQGTSFTGGWKGVRYYWSSSLPGGVPTVTWAEDGVSITASSTAAGSLLVTEKAVDVSQYSELIVDCASASDQVFIQLSTGTGDQFKTGQAASGNITVGSIPLDISALTGAYYIGIQCRAQKKTTIKSILLKQGTTALAELDKAYSEGVNSL